MRDSADHIALLRSRIAAVERQCALARPASLVGEALVPLGHAGVDSAIGGGLARARLHELFAASADDTGAAAGFAAMLAARLAEDNAGANIVWLRERLAEARGGCLHAPGLVELGLDPGRVVLGVLDDPLSLLRVASEVVRCPDVDVAVIELWKNPRPLDLTASRRLAVAAEQSGVTALMLRAEAEPVPSAAQTRWRIGGAAAAPLEANAPGYPTLEIELLRQRGGPAGQRWQMEWDRDQKRFREPALSRPVVPLSERGSLATHARRAG